MSICADWRERMTITKYEYASSPRHARQMLLSSLLPRDTLPAHHHYWLLLSLLIYNLDPWMTL
jgi:hypothetical protein